MPDLFMQAERLIAVDTPLGVDQLLLRTFNGSEGISKLFHFQLDMLSHNLDIDFDDIVGQKVTVTVRLADGARERYFNGYVSRFVQLPGEERHARYQAEVVPWLWFLTRTSDCRIFQNKTVPEVIQKVFKDFGFADFELQVQGKHDPWEYCVQYRETACDFVMRLMEQEGIFFFFRHEQSKHVMVIADSPSAHKPCPGADAVRYERVFGPGYNREEDVVLRWRYQQEFRPGKFALRDYNFETPNTDLLSKVESEIDQGGNHRFEMFDYPGDYEKRDQGDSQVKLRIEEQELPHVEIRADSNCRLFSSGFRFELFNHERKDQNQPYVLTEITHSADSGSFYSDNLGEGATYSNEFACMPFSVHYRPLRKTKKHLVQGPQTAVVVGPKGEEIYTDKYGRVKVQFHWDRVGDLDEKSSCWIRVSQPWAGKNWGAMWIPRIGQEVVVDFLEGDPDRPIITGRVYNADQMPPYNLPAGQTQSGFKSRSSKGGGGYNEISMDDIKGKEKITIHAQYDMGTTVEHDDSQIVHHDRTIHVDGTHTETIKREMLVTSEEKHIYITADTEIKLEVGASKLVMKKDGTISLKGKDITVSGTGKVVSEASATNTIKGSMVMLNP